MRVAQELDITNLQNHMQGHGVAGILQNLDCLLLGVRQGWNLAGIGEAGERLDEVWIIFEIQSWIVRPWLEVDDTGFDIWLLALADLAFAVEIPDRLGESLRNVGMFLDNGIPDVVG